jgi:hypothetical protein
MTDVSLWVITLGGCIGGIGGALNAALSDRAPVLPSVVTLSPGQTRVLRVGVAGNIVTGAAAALSLCWVVQLAGINLDTTDASGLLLGICDLFVAFVSARWATNEVDKLVLRKAVFKAASAPAAHPDLVGEMEQATPYTLYTLVDRLLPRRAGQRLLQR